MPSAGAMLQRVLLVTALASAVLGLVEDGKAPVINVVLMGATGNLAQKYLWQGLFNIMATPSSPTAAKLALWPAATKSPEISQPLMDKIVRDNVTYREYPNTKAEFLSRVGKYHALKDTKDFVKLQNTLRERELREREVGRVVYMSVPPKAFGAIAAEIHTNLRPLNKDAWLKVIVEKPFGVDLASAKQLSADLFHSLSADEVLLVDHYMGKFGLHAMRYFHDGNPHYRDVLRAKNVDNILISMVETEDVKGRTSFYDDVGVVRDTMQNHLMMMLSLLAMQPDKSEVKARLEVAKAVRAPQLADVLQVAQYTSYVFHVKDDRAEANLPAFTKAPTTPTYARIVLRLEDAHPLGGVPVVFSSGKAMARRRAFAVINFKDGNELVFNVQGEYVSKDGTKLKEAAVFASSGLPLFDLSNDWTKDAKNPRLVSGPANAPSAYQVMLRDVLEGRFESFVNIPEVLESWRYWDAMLKLVAKAPLESYDHGGKGIALKQGEHWPDVDGPIGASRTEL